MEKTRVIIRTIPHGVTIGIDHHIVDTSSKNVVSGEGLLKLLLEPKAYRLDMQNGGHQSSKADIYILRSASEPQEFFFDLELPMVEITTDPPGADVSVDDEYKGTTDLVNSVRLHQRTGIVKVSKSGYCAVTRDLAQLSAQDGPLHVKLAPRTLKFDVDPVNARVSVNGSLINPPHEHSFDKPLNLRIETDGCDPYSETIDPEYYLEDDLPVTLKRSGSTSTEVTIYTVPQQVDVSIDGRRIGRSAGGSLSLSLPPGAHSLELSAEAYEELTGAIVVDVDSPSQNYSFDLLPLQRPLRIRSEPCGATVYLDGHIVGVTTSDGYVAVSQRVGALTAELEGYESQSVDLASMQGSSYTFVLQGLAPPEAEIIVETNPPGAYVDVDGAFKGTTDANGILSLVLVAGLHTFSIYANGYIPQTAEIDVGDMEDDFQTLSWELEPEPRAVILLSTIPTGAEIYADNVFIGETQDGAPLELDEDDGRSLEARKAGFKTTRVDITQADDGALTVKLPPDEIGIWVRTNPRGARLTVNGQDRGVTSDQPLHLKTLTGNVTFIAKKRFYKTLNTTYSLSATDNRGKIDLKLQRSPIPLVVCLIAVLLVGAGLLNTFWDYYTVVPFTIVVRDTISNKAVEGAEVYINGQSVGFTPSSGTVVSQRLPRAVTIKAQKRYYGIAENQTKITSTGHNVADLHMRLQSGDVEIVTAPNVNVSMNNTDQGTTDAQGRLLLTDVPFAEKVQMTFSSEKHISKTQVVNLKDLQPIRPNVYLWNAGNLDPIMGTVTVGVGEQNIIAELNDAKLKTPASGVVTFSNVPVATPLHITLRKPCYDKITLPDTFTLTKQTLHHTVKVRPTFKKVTLDVTFETKPAGVSVSVDGQNKGVTGLDGKLLVKGFTCGSRHKLTWQKSGFIAEDTELLFADTPIEAPVVRMMLSRLPLTVKTEPARAEVFVNSTQVGTSDDTAEESGKLLIESVQLPREPFKLRAGKKCYHDVTLSVDAYSHEGLQLKLEGDAVCAECPQMIAKGQGLVEAARYAEAIQQLQQTSAKCGQSETILLNIGTAYAKLKKYQEAKLWLRKTVDYNEQNANAWHNLGYCIKRLCVPSEVGQGISIVQTLSQRKLELEVASEMTHSEIFRATTELDQARKILQQMKAEYDYQYSYRKRYSRSSSSSSSFDDDDEYGSSYYYSARRKLKMQIKNAENNITLTEQRLAAIKARREALIREAEGYAVKLKEALLSAGAQNIPQDAACDLIGAKQAFMKALNIQPNGAPFIEILDLLEKYPGLALCSDLQKLKTELWPRWKGDAKNKGDFEQRILTLKSKTGCN